jgi:urease accessory protein
LSINEKKPLMEVAEPVELQIVERLHEALPAETTLTLPFELRQKSRLRTWLDNGADVGLFLPRGTVMRHGDRLRTKTGLVVEVHAASESVSTAYADNELALARAAYHLGNRHIPLQINAHWLRYLHDHVLDKMVQELGLQVIHEQAPFEPEAGAHDGVSAHHHHHHSA